MAHLVNVEWQKINLGRLAIALGTTSLLENLLYHPWWVLKTREQAEVINRSGGVWRNSYHFARKILQKEGIKALYRGFWAGSIGSLPSAYLYLISYHKAKHELTRRAPPTLQITVPFIAGILAEAASLLFFVPIDVITQRMQLLNTLGRNSFTVAKDLIKNEGFLSLYRGTLLTGLKLGIGSGVWWLAYEQNKSSIVTITGREPSAISGIISGFIAGILSTIITNPLDVVKTRIQMQVPNGIGIPYRKAIDGFKDIWLKEGWRGLNRGLAPKIISQGPLSAFWAVIYELVLKYSLSSH